MAARMITRTTLAPVFALLLAGSAAQARDFGTHGPLWEIAEPNLLEVIQTRLHAMEDAGEIAAMQQEMQD